MKRWGMKCSRSWRGKGLRRIEEEWRRTRRRLRKKEWMVMGKEPKKEK
jgi:hypothetical protein